MDARCQLVELDATIFVFQAHFYWMPTSDIDVRWVAGAEALPPHPYPSMSLNRSVYFTESVLVESQFCFWPDRGEYKSIPLDRLAVERLTIEQ